MPGLRNLSDSSAAILRVVVAAIRPRGHGFDQPIDEDVIREIDRTIPFLPAPLRLALPVGLRLLDCGPCIFIARIAPMRSIDPAQAPLYL